MSAVAKRASERQEEFLKSVKEVLERKRYPDVNAVATEGVSKEGFTKDLLMDSVCNEDPVVTAMFSLPSSPVSIVQSFQKFVGFVKNSAMIPPKEELLQFLLYPLFVHCYLILVTTGNSIQAQKLFSSCRDAINSSCSDLVELRELLNLTTSKSISSSSLAEKFRSNKYVVRLSDRAFSLLLAFLQTTDTPGLMNVIQNYLSVEVYGKTMKMNGEFEAEGRNSLEVSFVKPQINPMRSYVPCPPRQPAAFTASHLIPPPSESETSSLRSEFKQRLAATTEKLEPAPPSVLLYTVYSPRNWVQCGSINTQSKFYACGFEDSSVRMWSQLPAETTPDIPIAHSVEHPPTTQPQTNEQLLLGHHGPVYDVCFDSSGKFLLSASENTTVRLWSTNASSGSVACYNGHQYPVWNVSFGPVDGYFVTSSFDRTARLWNTDAVYSLRIFAGHEASVDVAGFHPNGNYVASGSTDQTCRLWDVNKGSCARLFTGAKTTITSLAFSPNGKHLASGGANGVVHLWDLGSAKMVGELRGHVAAITALGYSPDGTLLVSSSQDHTLKFWNPGSAQTSSSSPAHEVLSQSIGSSTVLSFHFSHRNCLQALATANSHTHQLR